MKKSKKSKILFLYVTPAQAHKIMAEKLNATFMYAFPWKGSGMVRLLILLVKTFQIPKHYDIYFCEGSSYLFPATAKLFGLLKGKIILICADQLFHDLNKGFISPKKAFIYKTLLKKVDGFLCIGKMVKHDLQKIIPNANAIVIYPEIENNKKNLLLKHSNIIPNLRSKRIIFIGRPDFFYKGIDLLIEVFIEIKRIYPDAELTIVGDWSKHMIKSQQSKAIVKISEQKILNTIKDTKNNINILSNLNDKDFVKTLKSSALYLHLGRGDAFPLTVVEAMLAGLPAIVSNETGPKELIKQLNADFVVPLNKDEIIRAVTDYFSMSERRKLFLSKQSINIIKRFYLKSNSELFIKKFYRLVNKSN